MRQAMMTPFEAQKKFMRACGQDAAVGHFNFDQANLYYNLITEGYTELSDALTKYARIPGAADPQEGYATVDALNEMADGCIDILVVTIGMLLSMGLDPQRLWDEVMRANMAKIGPTGMVSKDPETGKVQKPEGWTPPDLRPLIAEMLWGRR